MAAFRLKDLTAGLGAAVGAVAQTGVAMCDVERNMKAMGKAMGEIPAGPDLLARLKNQGWQFDMLTKAWQSPDRYTAIAEQCLMANPQVAEEIFLNWLREKNDWQPPQANVNSRCTVASAVYPSLLALPDRQQAASAFHQCEEPVSFSRYIPCKAEPDDPLKWLDSQVEAVCKAGRL